MNQSMPPEPTPMPEQPKKSNTGLIIAIVIIVLCCLCIVVGGLLYQFGDQILKALGMA